MNPLESRENKIAGFIYKAQVLQESVLDLCQSRSKKSELSFESISTKVSLSYFDVSLVDEAKKMSAVYIAIASFENMLRGIVVEKLLIEKGEDWWNSDAISTDIRSKADKKLAEEKQNRCSGQLISDTSLGCLAAISCS